MNAILQAEIDKNRRWLPRFDLRSFFVALTLFCVLIGAAMAWYRTQLAEYDRQMRIAQSIKQLGCQVVWEENLPKWLHWLPADQVAMRSIKYATHRIPTDVPNIRGASASLLQVIDELQKVPTVRYFRLFEGNIDDDVLRGLGQLQQLKVVTVEALAKRIKNGEPPSDHIFPAPASFKVTTLDHKAVDDLLSKTNPRLAASIDELLVEIQKQLPNAKIEWRIVFDPR